MRPTTIISCRHCMFGALSGIAACSLALFFFMVAGNIFAASHVQAAPLLLEGKKTLFQRVVSHPGARLMAGPAADAAVVKENVTPFTVFYVYARNEGWLQVGAGAAAPEGWLDTTKATDWNQSLTLLFTPRTGRDPVLFFKTENALNDVCAAPDMVWTSSMPNLPACCKAAKFRRTIFPCWPANLRTQPGRFQKSGFISCPFWT